MKQKGVGVLAVLCVFLGAACVCDYKSNRVPNSLIAVEAVFGMGWCMWSGGIRGLLLYPGKILIIMALLYPLFKIGTLGAGDVKLFGVTAGYLPFNKILFFLFFSLLIAAVISLIKMWKQNNFGERMWYLSEYLADVIRSGSWLIYLENGQDRQAVGICMAGPVLFSVLLYLGGIY